MILVYINVTVLSLIGNPPSRFPKLRLFNQTRTFSNRGTESGAANFSVPGHDRWVSDPHRMPGKKRRLILLQFATNI